MVLGGNSTEANRSDIYEPFVVKGLFYTASTTNIVSERCHFSACPYFFTFFIPLIFPSFYMSTLIFVACPILTEAGSSENVSDTSTDDDSFCCYCLKKTSNKKHLLVVTSADIGFIFFF